MKKLTIKKRSGGTRVIYSPSGEEKTKIRAHLTALTAKGEQLLADSVHGFRPRRSPITNAMPHRGHRHTVSMDLANFFDTCRPKKGLLTEAQAVDCLIDGVPRQGLPTSPVIANLCAVELDRSIDSFLSRIFLGTGKAGKRAKKALRVGGHPLPYVVTRYADDISVSWDDPKIDRHAIIAAVSKAVAKCGFRVNAAKTRYQDGAWGNRCICGVVIAADGKIQPTRAVRKKLRAALHQDPTSHSARGLAEWTKMTPPRTHAAKVLTPEKALREGKKLARVWKLPVNWEAVAKLDKIAEITDGDFILTTDPVYMLGLSTYTSGWEVCTTQPVPGRRTGGSHRLGPALWLHHPSVAVAGILSEKKMTFRGVTRRVLRSRTLVYRLGSGALCADRLYAGGQKSRLVLANVLKRQGISTISEAVEKNPGARIAEKFASCVKTRAMVNGTFRAKIDTERGTKVVKLYLDNLKNRQGRLSLPTSGFDLNTEGGA